MERAKEYRFHTTWWIFYWWYNEQGNIQCYVSTPHGESFTDNISDRREDETWVSTPHGESFTGYADGIWHIEDLFPHHMVNLLRVTAILQREYNIVSTPHGESFTYRRWKWSEMQTLVSTPHGESFTWTNHRALRPRISFHTTWWIFYYRDTFVFAQNRKCFHTTWWIFYPNYKYSKEQAL